jgi:hypothetical protein
MTGADPTAEAVAAFRDPSKWDLVKRAVPIFVPHEIAVKDRDGRKRQIKVDGPRLYRIAANARRLWEQRGVAIKFFEGHTLNPGRTPQREQPRILAFGTNPQVIDLRGEPTLVCDQFIRRGCLDACRELPHRSAEFYEEKDEIPSVAMLRTEPRLDMGMVFYGQVPSGASRRDGLWLYMRDCAMAGPASQPGDDLDPSFEESAHKYMGKHYKHLSAMHQSYADTLPPDEGADPQQGAGMDVGGSVAMGEGGAPAFPSGTNGGPPAPVMPDKREYQRLQRRVDYQAELYSLALKGHSFDVQAELNDCDDMDRAAFDRHLDRLKRAPVAPVNYGAGSLPIRGPAAPKGQPAGGAGRAPDLTGENDPRFNQIVEYMRTAGCDYDQAAQAVMYGRK